MVSREGKCWLRSKEIENVFGVRMDAFFLNQFSSLLSPFFTYTYTDYQAREGVEGRGGQGVVAQDFRGSGSAERADQERTAAHDELPLLIARVEELMYAFDSIPPPSTSSPSSHFYPGKNMPDKALLFHVRNRSKKRDMKTRRGTNERGKKHQTTCKMKGVKRKTFVVFLLLLLVGFLSD